MEAEMVPFAITPSWFTWGIFASCPQAVGSARLRGPSLQTENTRDRGHRKSPIKLKAMAELLFSLLAKTKDKSYGCCQDNWGSYVEGPPARRVTSFTGIIDSDYLDLPWSLASLSINSYILHPNLHSADPKGILS